MEAMTVVLLGRVEVHKKIKEAQEQAIKSLMREVVENEGRCRLCGNGHYPHCISTGTSGS